jgi:hypothetical protein
VRILSFVVLTLSSTAALCTAADTLSSRFSKDTSSHELNPRSDTGSGGEYVVWPKDGNNKDAVAKTEDFLKQLTRQSTIYSHTDPDGEFVLWLVNVTDSHVDTIKQIEGVDSVEPNVIIAEDFAAVPVQTEPAKLSEANKAKRDT